MDIFSKVGAVVTAGTLIFSDIAFNAQYVSAENEVFPETLTITEKNYTGSFINSYNIDIDNDGIKERIGRYHIDKIDYSASDFYCIYNDDSEPYIMFKEPSNDHVYINVHIIQDNNTGETFFGYSYGDITESESLHKLYPDGQEQLIVGYNGPNYTNGEKAEYEKYLEYMQNVTFLDQIAYGKGDVDGDADITLSDASMMLSCYADNAAGLTSEINEIQKNAADMDKDGEITISDASTALSLYAEHAAGIIDTLILPPTAEYTPEYESSIKHGELESVYYFDIDNDNYKETIGIYKVSQDSSSYFLYEIYDNGILSGTFCDYRWGTPFFTYSLINDKNINETYLICIRCKDKIVGHATSIIRAYPIVDNSKSNIIIDAFVSIDLETKEKNGETIQINGQDVTKQDIYNYLNNLEIINSSITYEEIKNDFDLTFMYY